MVQFQVGDVVEWAGTIGKVKLIDHDGIWPVFPGQGEIDQETFQLDGKLYEWHKEPSLKLVERPKKKIKKTETRS